MKQGWPSAKFLYYYPGLTATPSKRRGMGPWPVFSPVNRFICLHPSSCHRLIVFHRLIASSPHRFIGSSSFSINEKGRSPTATPMFLVSSFRFIPRNCGGSGPGKSFHGTCTTSSPKAKAICANVLVVKLCRPVSHLEISDSFLPSFWASIRCDMPFCFSKQSILSAIAKESSNSALISGETLSRHSLNNGFVIITQRLPPPTR